jgi:tetratricopeptide (TPR) repeat protein
MRRTPAVSRVLIALVFCMLPAVVPGQTGSANLTVRVAFNDDRPVSSQVKVELYTGSNNFVTQAFTDGAGTAYFRNIASGSYQLRVSGQDAEETNGNPFLIQRGEFNHFEYVKVKRLVSQSQTVTAPPSLVDVSELNIPGEAQKSFDKGMDAFRKSRLDEARKSFEKAVAVHPQYASAYNLLGMTFMREGQTDNGRAAFEKALAINSNFALASRNLAKVYCNEEKIEQCEMYLQKSAASDPTSAETLTILAHVEFMQKKYEQASSYARRVHALSHKDFAYAHLVAARALRAQEQRQESIEEYKLFLQEAPNSVSSPQARQELTQLEKQGQ